VADRDLLQSILRDLKALGNDPDDEEGSLIRDVRKLWRQGQTAVEGLPESLYISLFLSAIANGIRDAAVQAGENLLRELDGKPLRGL